MLALAGETGPSHQSFFSVCPQSHFPPQPSIDNKNNHYNHYRVSSSATEAAKNQSSDGESEPQNLEELITLDMSFNRRSLDWEQLQQDSPSAEPRPFDASQSVKALSLEEHHRPSGASTPTSDIPQSFWNWSFPSEPAVPPRQLLWGPYRQPNGHAPASTVEPEQPTQHGQRRDSIRSKKRSAAGVDVDPADPSPSSLTPTHTFETLYTDKDETDHNPKIANTSDEASLRTPKRARECYKDGTYQNCDQMENFSPIQPYSRFSSDSSTSFSSGQFRFEPMMRFDDSYARGFPSTPTTPNFFFSSSPSSSSVSSISSSPMTIQSIPEKVSAMPYSFHPLSAPSCGSHYQSYSQCPQESQHHNHNHHHHHHQLHQSHSQPGYSQPSPVWSEQWYHAFNRFRYPQIIHSHQYHNYHTL